MKRFLLYVIRWQLSTPILAFAVVTFNTFGTFWATVVANFIGACVFFFVDKWIFRKGKNEKSV